MNYYFCCVHIKFNATKETTFIYGNENDANRGNHTDMGHSITLNGLRLLHRVLFVFLHTNAAQIPIFCRPLMQTFLRVAHNLNWVTLYSECMYVAQSVGHVSTTGTYVPLNEHFKNRFTMYRSTHLHIMCSLQLHRTVLSLKNPSHWSYVNYNYSNIKRLLLPILVL